MNNFRELNDIIYVLESYKMDSMGESEPYTLNQRRKLIEQLKFYPRLYVFLAYRDDKVTGGALCFNTFSSFTAMDIINIHDICVIKEFRKLGIGHLLMKSIILKASELNCSRVTLEVRADNGIARRLYRSLNFTESIPVMNFWRKDLSTT